MTRRARITTTKAMIGSAPDDGAPPMPNQPRKDNPARAIRVADDLWRKAQERAAERGETVSDVVRRALERYVR